MPAAFCPTRGDGLIGVIAFKIRRRRKFPSRRANISNFSISTQSPTAAWRLEYLVANFGADHVLLGSDYPYDMGDPEPVATLAASGIDATRINRIASANACKLLRIGI